MMISFHDVKLSNFASLSVPPSFQLTSHMIKPAMRVLEAWIVTQVVHLLDFQAMAVRTLMQQAV